MNLARAFKNFLQFVVNTGDNFYVHGCYADNNTAVPWYLRCSARFQHDWVRFQSKSLILRVLFRLHDVNFIRL